MKRTNLLSAFFNAKSDNSHLEATEQEQLENNFQEFMTGQGEKDAVAFVDEMAIENLAPEHFENWEKIKEQFKNNRKSFQS